MAIRHQSCRRPIGLRKRTLALAQRRVEFVAPRSVSTAMALESANQASEHRSDLVLIRSGYCAHLVTAQCDTEWDRGINGQSENWAPRENFFGRVAVRRPTRIVTSFAICAAPLLIGAGKPSPTPTPTQSSFIPEVIYRYTGSAGYDVRLGNAAGDAAVLLHRSSLPLYDLDMAPPSAKAAVVVERTVAGTNRLVLRTWAQDPSTGAIDVAPARILYETNNIYYPDFSPDGTKISFMQWDGGFGPDARASIRIVDLASGTVEPFATGLIDPEYPVWSRNGDAFYYASVQQVNGVNTWIATRHPTDGSSPTIMFQKAKISRWDISRDGTDKLILTISNSSEYTRSFSSWDGSSISSIYPQLIGSAAHYSCGNARMIYTSYTRGGKKGPLKVFTPSTGADVYYTKDQNADNADWQPC